MTGQNRAGTTTPQVRLFQFTLFLFSSFPETSEEGIRISSLCVRARNEGERELLAVLF